MVTKVRAGFGVWRWLHTRSCTKGHEVKILGGDTRRPAQMAPGAIRCPQCESQVSL